MLVFIASLTLLCNIVVLNIDNYTHTYTHTHNIVLKFCIKSTPWKILIQSVAKLLSRPLELNNSIETSCAHSLPTQSDYVLNR